MCTAETATADHQACHRLDVVVQQPAHSWPSRHTLPRVAVQESALGGALRGGGGVARGGGGGGEGGGQ